MSDTEKSIGQSVRDAVNDVKDTVSEAGHRSSAEGERVKRDAAGDAMGPGEKLGSVVNEVKHEVQGDIDRAKRESRHQP